MSLFTDLVTTPELINYQTNAKVGVQARTLSGLFPSKKLTNNKLITAVNKTFKPNIAHVHSPNATAEKVSYNKDVQTSELFDYRQQHEFDAQDVMDLAMAKDQDRDFLLTNIFEYGIELSQAIEDAVELARVQALTKGLFTQKDASGNEYKFDYNVSKDQKIKAVDFSDPTVDPIDYFLTAKRNADFAITRGVIEDQAFYAMMANKNVVQRVYGINSTVQSVMEGDLRNYFASQGLPTLLNYSDTYHEADKNGKTTSKKYMDKGALALFGDGLLGETIYGITPEESSQIISGAVQRGKVGEIMLSSYEDQNPITNTVLASAEATITLASRYQLLQGTVL